MTPVFADSFFWYALSNHKDQWHPLVLQARAAIGNRPLVTTDEVRVEFASAMASDKFLRASALTLINAIQAEQSITVIPQSHASFLAGLEFFGSRLDKQYSLVDCISMNVCRAEGIQDVLTNDHHFEQEGFSILIKR